MAMKDCQNLFFSVQIFTFLELFIFLSQTFSQNKIEFKLRTSVGIFPIFSKNGLHFTVMVRVSVRFSFKNLQFYFLSNLRMVSIILHLQCKKNQVQISPLCQHLSPNIEADFVFTNVSISNQFD